MTETTTAAGFAPRERRALERVLDTLVPARSELGIPGAGGLGVVSHVERVILGAPGLRSLILQGLAALDALAQRRGATDFAALPAPEREGALRELGVTDPHFVPTVTFHTYVGYYRDGRVWAGLGLEPRPPFPKGYELEAGDLSLLDGVRRRPRMYRDC